MRVTRVIQSFLKHDILTNCQGILFISFDVVYLCFVNILLHPIHWLATLRFSVMRANLSKEINLISLFSKNCFSGISFKQNVNIQNICIFKKVFLQKIIQRIVLYTSKYSCMLIYKFHCKYFFNVSVSLVRLWNTWSSTGNWKG